MDLVVQGLIEAFRLLATGDREVLAVTLRTLQVSGLATLVSMLLGLPAGLYLAFAGGRARRFALSLVYTGMGLPPVVVGLWVSLLLWRSGPLGRWELLYTPAAMVMAQAVIAFPLVAGLTTAALQQLPARFSLQVISLGASRLQLWRTLLREARPGVLAAVVAGFGAIVSEVGAANMVGGNIRGQTRVLTTATMLEVSRGNFGTALALGFILLGIALVVVSSLVVLQQRGVD